MAIMFTKPGLDLGDFVAPFVVLVIASVFAAFAWNLCRSIAVWASMKLKGYREREEVYLNGTRAVITKIGFMTTTFLILNDGGAVVMRWASVSNTSLDSQRIERISLRLSELEHKKTPSE